MRKMPNFVLLIVLLWIVPQGCSSNDDDSSKEVIEEKEEPVEVEKEAFFTLFIVDAPGDYSSVMVEVLGVKVVVDKDTIPLQLIWANSGQPEVEMLDLLEYTGGGYDVLIANHKVPTGELSAVILVLGENNSVVNGKEESFTLTMTEETKKGISAPFEQTIIADHPVELTLDFNVDASVSKSEENPGEYILDPVVRVFDNNATGHIYGYLNSELGENPAAVTTTLGDLVFSTQTYDREFMLWGLPAGSYTLNFSFSQASGIDDLIVENVQVSAEEITSLGQLGD